MALALRLFLLLLLAVALHARAAQAAPVPVRGADEDTGNVSPLHWLREVLKPFRPPAGVSTGKTFPGPVLVPPQEPSSHGRDAAGATINAPKIQESTGRDFCWGTGCLSVIVASVLERLLVFLLCCAGIWYWWVRKWLLSAPAPAQPNTSGRKSWTSHLCSSCPKLDVLTRLKNDLLTLLVQLPQKGAPLPLSPAAPPSSPV
ncbi:uncharacterized protein LOC135420517 isoform X1 [Pseudopipra pipra]|uniref:uncharacterized protein LOC135420517 isoform X1 n=1 Tax=Pseudopipra pipra TaxID=415032 RepID=UPI003138CD67